MTFNARRSRPRAFEWRFLHSDGVIHGPTRTIVHELRSLAEARLTKLLEVKGLK